MKFREAYLWPYINVHDLSKAKTLPLFLAARAQDTPNTFAHAEFEAIRLGIVSESVMTPFLNNHTFMLNRWDRHRYGELIAWEDDDDAFMTLISQRGMHPGQGLLVMEIQERIYGFLVSICEHILHDIGHDALLSALYVPQPMMPLDPESTEGYSSLAIMAAQAPYRRPASMDLSRLASLLDARKTAAEDHVWSLREDPNYFVDALLEFRENRQEMLLDTNGRKYLLNGEQDEFWRRILGNVVSNAYYGYEIWRELHRQAENLRHLRQKYAGVISPEMAYQQNI